MRRISRMLVLVSAMALGLATLTAAQMMGGNQEQMMKQNTDSTTQNGMTNNVDSLTTRMQSHWSMMSGEFSKLDSQFQNMMKIDDLSKLKAEMQRYHQSMMQMRQDMMQQQNMWQQMSSMMQSGHMQGMHGTNGMHGTMGMSQPGSQGTQQKTDNN